MMEPGYFLVLTELILVNFLAEMCHDAGRTRFPTRGRSWSLSWYQKVHDPRLTLLLFINA